MQASEYIEILQALPIFGGINAHSIQFLLDRSSTCNVPQGQYFFHEGDNAESLFVLEQGRADLLKLHGGKEYFLRQMDKGDCFGEVAIMDLMPRSASVRAHSDCHAIELSRLALYELYQADLEQFTMIQMNMGREVSRRLRQADERLFAAGLLRPEAKQS
jgi:CRP-like cAMP-binding protein